MTHHKNNRRHFLKAGAASMALPILPFAAGANTEDMLVTGRTTDGKSPKRFVTVYFPFGVSLPPEGHPAHENDHWFPLGGPGTDYRLTKSLDPLADYRSQMSIISGLSHPGLRRLNSHGAADHYLTGDDQSKGYNTAVTIDQLYAQTQVEMTRYKSLVMSSNGGIGNPGKSNTISFNHAGQPIPTLAKPRQIFDRMFGVSGPLSAEQKILSADKSILDRATGSLKAIQSRIGREEGIKLDEYLSAVRGLEEQTKRAERWLDVPKPDVDPSQFHLDIDASDLDQVDNYLETMYDMIFMAFKTDTTRVATFMIHSEGSTGLGNSFPTAMGLQAHHGLSHGSQMDGGFEKWAKYDRWLTQKFAYFMKRMSETDDPFGEGSLLDNTVILYGCASGKVHDTNNYPTILAGGKNMGLKHGAYHDFHTGDADDHFNNLLLTIAQTLGLEYDNYHDSNRTLSALLT